MCIKYVQKVMKHFLTDCHSRHFPSLSLKHGQGQLATTVVAKTIYFVTFI